jgi:hypothetical protein
MAVVALTGGWAGKGQGGDSSGGADRRLGLGYSSEQASSLLHVRYSLPQACYSRLRVRKCGVRASIDDLTNSFLYYNCVCNEIGD